MGLESFFSLDNWPVLFLCLLLIAAATIDFCKFKVPNSLTFPMILGGWAFGLVVAGLTGWWASFVLSFFGLVLLLPVYAIGGMGAGDVKMQMGFGAWVGAIFGVDEGFWIVLYGFCLAAIVGGVIAAGMMFWRGDFFQNRKNVGEILRDWVGSKSMADVAEKAALRKPRMHLLPYGVPLCIGFISYLLIRAL